MKRGLSIILCITLILCLVPSTSSFAAKKIKSKSVSIAPKSMTLAIGDIAQLNATMKPSNSTDKLSWSSSNKAVATVTSKGMVKGKAVGKATITVKTTSKKTAKCTVTVKRYATENDILSAIKANTCTRDDILSTIKDNTYTKEEVDSKIGSVETNTKEYVTSDEAITSIMDKLKSAFATEDSVLALIKQNTYTKSEIDALIESAQSSSSSAWEDGTEISLFPGQSLPFTSGSITIESISAKKYRNAQIDERCVNCPYRIAWKISGSFSCTEDWFRRSSTVIEFRAYNGDCSAGSTYVHVPKDTVKINGNSFEFETTENTMTVGDRLLFVNIEMMD